MRKQPGLEALLGSTQRREMKRLARQNVKRHYLIFIFICLIAAAIGAEFRSELKFIDLDSTRIQAVRNFLTSFGPRVSQRTAAAFWLVGRKDYENDGTGGQNRAPLEALLDGLDMDRPVLLMDHEPRFLQQSTDAGVDVCFSGHTHGGQTFPLNLAVSLQWENPSGMLIQGSMTSIVASGVGVYGPDLRVGTDADVTVVDLAFAQQ